MEDEDEDEEDEDKDEEDHDEDKSGDKDQEDIDDKINKPVPEEANETSQHVSDGKNSPSPNAEQRPLVNQKAFFEAAKNGDIEIVKLALLQSHVDINAKTPEHLQRTALNYTCQKGHEAIVKLLLGRKELLIDAQEKDGTTALSWACCKGYESIVKLLLERDDIQVNLAENDGWTPLMHACLQGKENIHDSI
ncbi:Similar to Ankyrin repeat and KH domain-containing protein R11A8.7; acc. no. Q21920 [Pyronema omphalodes CBS 100304]|uniref:Similar to Ankyrin repeat and KH domain-containing protein R11A8.7 acc. no. Q21920 n=1 Tax=Pyronema omphalodes (strain CBS 100304) TaxID=1076935 RepID=U4LBY1_PYROM|nr:Similar to Ankyrin repeat and KH domain-containing protein R11A8.7; acc. no. Q21920 [Pyronema omphalodes CBS 100304]